MCVSLNAFVLFLPLLVFSPAPGGRKLVLSQQMKIDLKGINGLASATIELMIVTEEILFDKEKLNLKTNLERNEYRKANRFVIGLLIDEICHFQSHVVSFLVILMENSDR